MREVDVVVIGGGTAGMAAYSTAKRKTKSTLIINDGPWGTICARVGCMPSKALLQVADEYQKTLRLQKNGLLKWEGLELNSEKVMEWIRSKRDYLVSHVVKQTERYGDDRISGRAKFLDKNTIEVNGEKIRAKAFIVATGSRPVVPKEWSDLGEGILTSDSLFDLKKLPKSFAVVGLGPVGLEMGQALGQLGCKVAGFGRDRNIGALSDPAVIDFAFKEMEKSFSLHIGSETEIKKQDNGLFLVKNEVAEVEVEAVLVAIGRKPNLEGLELEKLDINCNQFGIPDIDFETTQICDSHIFMAGDSSGDRAIWHEALDEGRIAGSNVLEEKLTRYKRKQPMGITFTHPNIASVGKRFKELNEDEMAIGEIKWGGGGRTYVMESSGYLRVYGDKKTGKLLGAEMCAPMGENMAHQLIQAIENDLNGLDLIKCPFYHPTVEEGIHLAVKKMIRNSEIKTYQEIVPLKD